MENNKRACFALVAATLINNIEYKSVFDYQQGKRLSVSSSNISSDTPRYYDYNRKAPVSGTRQRLYDYATSSYVSIRINGNKVNCYDYETSAYINFTVNGSNVVAYDYENSSYFNYNVN